MKRLLTTGMIALTGLLLAMGSAACSRKGAGKGKTPSSDSASVKVVTAEVKEVPFEDWGSYSADLRGAEDAGLTAPFQGGRVNSVRAVGSKVNAGDALCDIDGERYEAALKAAEAQVEVAKGELERARINVEKGSLGRSALDGANLAFQNARMLLASARRAYEDSRCQAPFDGVLVSCSVEKYQTVTPGMPTVRVSRMDRFEAVVSIPETEAFSFTEGMKTEFRLVQDSTRVYQGRLKSIDRAVDSRSRTAMARIEIVSRDGKLRPGMVGRARILRRAYAKAVVIPHTALLHLQNGVAVMVAEQGVARQRRITAGASTPDGVLVTSGLKAGDRLIVSGAFQLSDGSRISF